jgi:hypothetical protein
MRAVSRGLRRHFPWNDRVWLVRGGAVALSPKRIAAICRSTSLLQGRARDFLRGTHSLKPNFVSVTVFPCASSKLCFAAILIRNPRNGRTFMTSAIRLHVSAAVASTGMSLSAPAQAQQATMSFFVTSVRHVSSPRGAECASELRM